MFAIFVVPLLILRCTTSSPSSGVGDNAMSYNRLKLMDLDQMTELLQQKVKEFKRTGRTEALQEGLQICLSRPDEDTLVEKTISIVRNPLEDIDQWESSVENLVDTNLEIFKNMKAHSSDQVTAGIILENVISEFKPQFQKQYVNPGFESRIIEKIAAAKVEFNRKAVSERKLTLMRGAVSPSLLAQKLMDRRADAQKK